MTQHRRIIVALIIIMIVLLGFAFFAHRVRYFAWDLTITKLFQQSRSSFWDTFWGAISWPGYPPQVNALVPLLILILLVKGFKKEALMEALAATLTTIVGYSFKIGVNRMRPSDDLINVVHKGLEGGKYSFPAGHVQSFMGVIGFLAIIAWIKIKNPKQRRIIVGVIIIYLILLGPSRIYLGEHWASDVVAAYLVGFFVLGILTLIYDKLLKYEKENR